MAVEKNPHIVLVYTLGNRIHEMGFSVSEGQFNSYAAQTDGTFQATGVGIANFIKTVASTDIVFTAVRLKNVVGAVVRERGIGNIPGEKVPTKKSRSATIAFLWRVPASGITGKNRTLKSFLYLGHADYHREGQVRNDGALDDPLFDILTNPSGFPPVSTRSGGAGAIKGYVSLHYNTSEQDIAGS